MSRRDIAKLETLAGKIEWLQHQPAYRDVADQLYEAKKAILAALRKVS